MFYFFRYLFCCSYSHSVAPQGKFISFVTTEAETDDPESELKPGVDLLGPLDEIFYETYDRFEPTNNGDDDSCFVSTVSMNFLFIAVFCMYFHHSSNYIVTVSYDT